MGKQVHPGVVRGKERIGGVGQAEALSLEGESEWLCRGIKRVFGLLNLD
jgi:hypothetical protein